MSSLHTYSCKDGYLEDMPFLEQIVAMSGSFGGDGHQFMGYIDNDSSGGEQYLGASYLSGWNLDLEKQPDLDNDLVDVLIDPRTMAPICIEPASSDDQLVDVEKLPPFEGFEDLPESIETAPDKDVVQPLFVVPTETMETIATVPERTWNREVLLIQIAPAAKPFAGSMLKSKRIDGTRNAVTQTSRMAVVEERYEKPPFSYSCLIALALKNSESGFLPVSEIYSFIL